MRSSEKGGRGEAVKDWMGRAEDHGLEARAAGLLLRDLKPRSDMMRGFRKTIGVEIGSLNHSLKAGEASCSAPNHWQGSSSSSLSPPPPTLLPLHH